MTDPERMCELPGGRLHSRFVIADSGHEFERSDVSVGTFESGSSGSDGRIAGLPGVLGQENERATEQIRGKSR
jgi:hypothetical protein